MIASLNIMVKMFTKIAKTFVRLSAIIVAIRIPIFILNLEAKYEKMNCKMKSTQKTRKQAPKLQKSTLAKRQQSMQFKVNKKSQRR